MINRIIKNLQAKHDHFIGYSDNELSVANNKGFRDGLEWAIDSINTEVRQSIKSFTDKEIERFLIGLTKEYYSQGDTYFAYKVQKKRRVWHFGYENDYPMQHGNGIEMTLPEDMVEVIMRNSMHHFNS